MERQILEKFRQTPEAQRLLDTISFAEGTNRPNRDDSYRVQYGGGLFEDTSRHPDQVVHGGEYSSAAAGRYQFMPKTWEQTSKRLGLTSFGAKEQDLGALKLARDRLLPIGGLATLQKEGLSPRVVNALAPEWASLPTLEGKSYYGQPVKSYSELNRFYQNTKPAAASGPTPPPPVEKSDTAPQESKAMRFLRNYWHFLPGFGKSESKPAAAGLQGDQILDQLAKPAKLMQ